MPWAIGPVVWFISLNVVRKRIQGEKLCIKNSLGLLALYSCSVCHCILTGAREKKGG